MRDVFSLIHRFDEAIAWRVQTLELEPDHEGTLINLIEDYTIVERYDDALRTYQKLVTARGEEELHTKALILASAGRKEEAHRILASVESGEINGYPPPVHIAGTYAVLGETGKAFEWLERAYEERPWALILLTTWLAPFFEDLADDPRYLDLVRRLNLEDTLERSSQ